MGRSNSRRRRENSTFTNRRLPTAAGPVRYVNPVSYIGIWDAGVLPSRFSLDKTAQESRYVTEKARNPRRRPRPNLRLVEDRRQWHPVGPQRAPSAYTRSSSRVVAPKAAMLAGAAVTAKLAFAGPSSVAICVRRQRRREVMFALRKNGRSGQRRPKRNWYSSIRCRR